MRTGGKSGAPMCHGTFRIQPRRFLEGPDRASVIETVKQRQALVEVTLRLCVFCCDLARIGSKPIVNRLTRIAACAEGKREKTAGKYMTVGSHSPNRV
jgi:hypothetical protein